MVSMAPPSEQDEQPIGNAAARPEHSSVDAPTVLELALGAEWVAPSIVRQRVNRWLQALRWPPAQIEELILAVSEAVSNSVEHGYRVPPEEIGHPGVVVVRGRMLLEPDGYRRVELTVHDGGTWREPSRGASTRGHGMLIMRTCVDVFTVDHDGDGTTVVMLSRPAPEPLERQR
jgi:serine/threonine-protein kinase RsbW